jgi:hypothetical protein
MMMSDPSNDPEINADLDRRLQRLLTEIRGEPIPAEIRALVDQLEAALRAHNHPRPEPSGQEAGI